jgi:hypothetical protein
MQDARATTFELFGDDNLRAMIHHAGPATEIAAAQSICKRRNRLQELVLQAFHDLGDMTDEQLERLAQFEHYAPSTIRKRRSELTDPRLFDAPPIVSKGVHERPGRTPMTIWGLRA